ncbi:MAG: YjjW family glycine radical enzyme activase [bacterium]|nr:YjjW family glycine radical enzyme activase [bacterium]
MSDLLVNKIIPFSNVDGPGNRFVIFLQECNLNCIYCHNPETLNRCNSCGKCIEACKTSAIKLLKDKIYYNKKSCLQCDLCLSTCPNNSSPKTINYSIDNILKKIERYNKFLSGITISGGECSLQHRKITDLYKLVKSRYPNLTLAIDTNGLFNINDIKSLIDASDFFIYDIKSVNNNEHKILTGSENKIIIYNLKSLLKLKKIYEVRTVICPPLINCEETVIETAKMLNCSDINYKLIKYRPMGVSKNSCSAEIPSDEFLLKLSNLAKKYHNKIVLT